jgi:hypothetical protein
MIFGSFAIFREMYLGIIVSLVLTCCYLGARDLGFGQHATQQSGHGDGRRDPFNKIENDEQLMHDRCRAINLVATHHRSQNCHPNTVE